jgi:hypothetical protein
MNLPNFDLNSLYQAALSLTEAERLTLARRMLESLERDKPLRGTDLRPLMGLGKDLWGSASKIDAFIEKERSQWDG